MDAQDFRSLQEAYLDVYEQEEALDEISDELATAARNLRQKRYTKSADQARNLQLSKGNRADMFYKNFDKTVKLNDTLKSRKKRTGTEIPRVEQLDLYDIILSHLIDEGYAETPEAAERIMVNMSEEWKETILEITGGKGHPGYKAGSRDLGPMQSGHPADSSKRTMKGGTMSMRHGDHLGDLDDDDDDDDDDGLEAGLKDSARKSRENVRKPLRNMVKTAAKRLNK